MKKHRPKLIAASFLLLGLLFYPFYAGWNEPSYQGRRVSYWFQQFCRIDKPGYNYGWTLKRDGRHFYNAGGEEMADPGRDALRQIGLPAVAWLTNRLASRGFGAASLYGRNYTNLPQFLQQTLPDPYQRERERVQAVIALSCLGSNAHPVAPLIVDYLIKQTNGAPLAILTLPAFQPSASEVERLVIALLHLGRFSELKTVVDGCGLQSPGLVKIIAEIIEMPGGPEFWAFQTLRGMGSNAAPAMPILLRSLSSTNRETRYQAARTFETIGPSAAAAAPALNRSLEDENVMVQSAAKRALQIINAPTAREVLAN